MENTDYCGPWLKKVEKIREEQPKEKLVIPETIPKALPNAKLEKINQQLTKEAENIDVKVEGYLKKIDIF